MQNLRMILLATLMCVPLDNLKINAQCDRPNWTQAQIGHWHYLIEELDVSEWHHRVSQKLRPCDLVIRNVNVVPMDRETILKGQTVFIAGGRIQAISPFEKSKKIDTEKEIDGTGKYLIPGLTDMHVHNLESNSQQLLNLAHGVTSVRDLDGFKWMLQLRDHINDQKIVAPRMFVSGTILNQNSFGGYARLVRTEADARRAVREQAQDGYDFIKVHNSLTLANFQAIAKEAKKQQVPLVGHIPVGISVQQAVDAGMRTFEHFKGYIDDSTLTLTDEDYVTATDGAKLWNSPTFVTYLGHLRGEDALKILAQKPYASLVSPRLQKAWKSTVDRPLDSLTRQRQNIFPLSRKIFADLRSLNSAKFVAGTDSGSLEMLVPGIALQQELQIFRQLGMSPFEALQTATTNAAAALNQSESMGMIKVGFVPDLVLLEANPLDDINNIKSIAGVIANSTWISKAEIDAMLSGLTEIFERSGERLKNQEISLAEINRFAARVKTLDDNGFVFRDQYLELAAQMFDELGVQTDANTIRRLKTEPEFRFDFLRFN